MFENFTQLNAEQQTLIETFGELDMPQKFIQITRGRKGTWYETLCGSVWPLHPHNELPDKFVINSKKKELVDIDDAILRTMDDAGTKIDATLKERGNRYGEFDEHARITQNIKGAMVDSPNWRSLSNDKKEALEIIAHKIGRMLNGDPDYIDNWHDIQGYAKLVEDILLRKQNNDVK